MDDSVLGTIPRNLWLDTLIRGVIAIIFGIAVFLWPGLTIAWFILLFAAFTFADGILLILQSITTRRHEAHWWVRTLQGLISIAAGVAVFVWPGLTALVLVYLIGFYLLVTGILQLLTAIEFRKVIKGELLLVMGGILSIFIGVLMFVKPVTGALALAQTIGIFAVAYGIVLCLLAFKLRGITERQPTTT